MLAAAGLAALAAHNARACRRGRRQRLPIGSFVEVDGIRLHYVLLGEGPCLVALHGNGSMIPELLLSDFVTRAAREFTVLIFDRPGYGWSDRSAGGGSPSKQAALMRKAASQLGFKSVRLLGHSWGALVAIEWALQAREEVRGLTLVSGYYHPTFRPGIILASLNALPVAGAVLRRTLSPVIVRAVWPALLNTIFHPQEVPVAFHEVDRRLVTSPDSLRASAEETAILIPSVAALQHRYGELGTLGIPILLAAGDEDRVINAATHAAWLKRLVPGAQLRLFRGVGHMVHHAEPEALLTAMAIERGLPQSEGPAG